MKDQEVIRDHDVMNALVELEEAKGQEAFWKAKRVAAEEKLLGFLNFTKLEGSSTYHVGLPGTPSTDEVTAITFTAKQTRTLHEELLEEVWSNWDLAEDAFPVKSAKPQVDLKKLRHLQMNEPKAYRAFAVAMSTKQAKASVSLKKVQG
jgi:hypothetical protein